MTGAILVHSHPFVAASRSFLAPEELPLLPHDAALFTLPVALLLRLALVVLLLAGGDAEFDLRYAAMVEIDRQRHERRALALHGADQLVHLVPVQKQLARAADFMLPFRV